MGAAFQHPSAAERRFGPRPRPGGPHDSLNARVAPPVRPPFSLLGDEGDYLGVDSRDRGLVGRFPPHSVPCQPRVGANSFEALAARAGTGESATQALGPAAALAGRFSWAPLSS
jgi:hypothetical protein